MNNDLKLLVKWSSPWEEFVTAIRPALSRSPAPLEAEAHTGLFPYRGGLAAMAAEIVLLVAMAILPSKLARLRPIQPAPPQKYDVIYFSGDELPRTEDAGGAGSGRSGRSGGREGHHATQVIRVARGPSLKEQVVDAPKLDLPNSDTAVANLLAYKSVPGPPPAEGLESSSRHAEMDVAAVPPAAAMQHENLQRAPDLETSVVAPTPSQHEFTARRVSGSRMDAVPPPVSAPREVAILHPQLTLPQSMVIPPAPSQAARGNARARFGAEDLRRQAVVPPPPQTDNTMTGRQAVGVGNTAVVAPPSEAGNALSVHRQTGSLGDSKVVPPPARASGSLMRQANGLSQGTSVVQPPPLLSAGLSTIGHRMPGSFGNSRIVPPPEQASGSLMRQAKGMSQGTSVVQPPPSVAAGSGSNGRPQPGTFGDSKVVPPPAQVSGSVMRQSSGLSQGSSVVQPPPSVAAGSSSNSRPLPGTFGDSKVVPPPAQVSGSVMRQSSGLSQGSSVVQPPPSVAAGSSSNSRPLPRTFGDSKVVPPPAQVSGSVMRQSSGLSQGSSVVQPPPSVAAGSNSNAQGRHGAGEMIASAAVAPPASASGIVLSARPGAKLGSPSAGSAGSLAMSPSGGAHPGLGGPGNGAGISHGNDTGSSTSGSGPGAKTNGSGPGSNELAHNGISPFPGTGGAGKGTSAAPTISGVSVSGGENNTIKLPSFGTDGAPIADLSHSPAMTNPGGPGITVVASAHSGGAFNFYGALKGDKVYTIYIDTAMGTAVMQFADPKSASQSYPEDLTAPQALRAELPSNTTPSRLVISCILDRSGVLKTPRVLDGNSSELSEKVLAALPAWKFRPAFRGNQPIEVNAILGFDIDTR